MSDFAPRANFDFAQAMIGFVKAQAGSIGPHHIRTHFISAVAPVPAETRAAPGFLSPQHGPGAAAAPFTNTRGSFDADRVARAPVGRSKPSLERFAGRSSLQGRP